MQERDIEADLDDWLDVPIPVEHGADPDDPSQDTVLPAADEEMADRILYKARRLTEERDKVSALAAKRRAEIDRWEADRTSGIDGELRRAQESLEAFLRQWHRANPRTKTVKLPNGTLSLRAPRGRIVVDDEYQFIAWAEKHRPDLLRMEPKVKKAELANEETIARHEGVQRNEPDGRLVQTWRLMAAVDGEPTPDGEPTHAETVSVPGVVYVEPVQDTFSISLTTDQPQEDK